MVQYTYFKFGTLIVETSASACAHLLLKGASVDVTWPGISNTKDNGLVLMECFSSVVNNSQRGVRW